MALGAAAAAVWLGCHHASAAWLTRAAELARPAPGPDEIRAAARAASAWFSVGVVVLAMARWVAVRRARDPLPATLLLPALTWACALGLVVQQGTLELARGHVLAPPGLEYARGFCLATVGAAAILLVPLDLDRVLTRSQHLLALAIAAIFLALAVAGSGPAGSGTRINLGPVQPIELVKLLTLLLLAAFLGSRASKLRWQRRHWLALSWPRPILLAPALGAVLVIFAGLFVVGDLGPVLLLSSLLLGLFYLVTRSLGWVLAALALVTALMTTLALWPELVSVGRVATRLRIWMDPWGNGLTHGHQVGEGLWAVAAGGGTGQGLAQSQLPLPAAARTDLVLATMMEQLGLLSLLAYLVLLAALVLGGLRIAARSRTSVRVLLAAGAALLLLVQWAVIHAGTFAWLPLTGIVAPFLSTGRSSMVVFVALVALLVRLAHDGGARELPADLVELHGAARRTAQAAAVLLAAGALTALGPALLSRREVSTRQLRITLGDGTVVTRPNPRLTALATQLRRGTLEDRHGVALAETPTLSGPRRYPLGTALGTLLGASPSRVLRPPWALERVFDQRLAGGPLTTVAPLLELPRTERLAKVRALDADLASRSVRLSLDARLQRRVAELLVAGASRRVGAAAAVVIDVDTGQVLARAQVPDLDPGDPSWQALLLRGGAERERFTAVYGPWPDRTGLQGTFQAGSVAKLFTALAAARAGLVTPAPARAGSCAQEAEPRYRCELRDAQGPLYDQPGWPTPIHDHGDDRTHGRPGLAQALAVSCNVYFAQLGLALGAEPLRALREAGVEIGYQGQPFAPGEAGSRQLASSAFGQGAMVLSPLAAARLAAIFAAGGTARRCPASMELAAPCPSQALLPDASALAPIVAGMRQVMTSGTGRRLAEPAGVRVYGKTGTADVAGFAGEAPSGIAPGAPAPPHSWFVGFAEPATTTECTASAPRRLAFAVVVPRGGAGAAAAGPLAMRILAAARELGYLAP